MSSKKEHGMFSVLKRAILYLRALYLKPDHRVTVGIYLLGCAFYACSLQGGTERWLLANAQTIVRATIISAALFYITIKRAITVGPVTMYQKLCGGLLFVALILVILRYDKGDTSLHHGSNNMIGCLVWMICFTIADGIYTLTDYSRTARICFRVFTILVFVICIRRLIYGYNVFPFGIVDDQLPNRYCTIPTPLYLSSDMLKGVLNSQRFTGDCSKRSFLRVSQPDEFLAEVDDRGYLNVHCPGPISLTPIPRTEGWSVKQRHRFFNFQMEILDYMDKMTFTIEFLESRDVGVTSWGASYRVHKKKLTNHFEIDLRSAATDDNPKAVEAVRVSCNGEKKLVMGAVPDPAVASRLNQYWAKNTEKKAMWSRTPNVLLLYVDAVSRRHFIRQFPKTVKLIHDIHMDSQDAEHFEFFRYHSIGRKTEPNTHGLFQGQPPNPDQGKPRDKFYTSAVPVWKEFKDNGFVTSIVTNSCEDWEGKYMHEVYGPESIDHMNSAPFCQKEYYSLKNPRKPWHGPFSCNVRCLFSHYVHAYVFDYIYAWFKVYDNLPKFMWAAFTEGHEPTGEVIRTVDEDMATLLETFSRQGALRTTAIMILSDHGLHMSPAFLMGEAAGLLENLMPLCHLLLPRSLLDSSADLRQNLLANQQKLVSSIDLHATLRQLAYWPNPPPPGPDTISNYERRPFRAKSLMGPIDDERSCADAGIPEDLCVCQIIS